MAIFYIWMEWFEQFMVSVLPWCLPSSFCSRGYMVWKQILFEVLKTVAMVAQNNDSAGSEYTIPSLMPYKLSHCALQICRWFLEFWSVQNSYLTKLSLCNIYMAVPFYTHWYYTTRQHTNTLFCGGNNISVSVIWTNPIYIKVNCHVLRQQLNCFGLKFCNCCLWVWRLSIWLVTSSYTVLMIQETLSLRHYIAHLFHWPSRPGQKTSGYDQELPQSQTTDGAVRNK